MVCFTQTNQLESFPATAFRVSRSQVLGVTRECIEKRRNVVVADDLDFFSFDFVLRDFRIDWKLFYV